ncbi:SubName: Full=Uncharacterized protein {ECO:0000313/EMBL:CCA67031.1} [Serendipita indica DSM 11827]|nr:SubName: Full=Uncharacterized protein {ECO:0000313/EMBL:CCA67031.1} [Serendipita indica DSM 11827]
MGITFSSRREDPIPEAAVGDERAEDDTSRRTGGSEEDDNEAHTDQESQEGVSDIPRRCASVASDRGSPSEDEEAHVARMLTSEDPEGSDDGNSDDQSTEGDIDDQQVEEEEEEEDHTHIDDWNVESSAEDQYVRLRNRL